MLIRKEHIDKINKEKEFILKKDLKSLDRNTLLLDLFKPFYIRMFKEFEGDLEKHLSYIKIQTQIDVSEAVYRHYIKTNFINIYNDFLNYKKIEKPNIDSIKYYSSGQNKKDMESDKKEIEALEKFSEAMKENVLLKEELNKSFALNMYNSILALFLLLLIIYII